MNDIKNISKPVFLHFLSRGLQMSVNSYIETSYHRVRDDFRFTLASTYEHSYISTAHLFENEYAFQLIKEFPKLFWYGHIQVSQKETSIKELIKGKQSQYDHVKSEYLNYYNDRWKRIVDYGPSIKYTKGISNYLHQDLLDLFGSRKIKDAVSDDENKLIISTLSPYLIEEINERRKKALTNNLFFPIYERFGVKDKFVTSIDRIVNEYYLRVQIQRDGGTIMTGISSGVEYYSFLCQTYPFHHLPIWKGIYQILGLRHIIREFEDIEFYLLRENPIFIQFVDLIRVIIFETSKDSNSDLLSIIKYVKYSGLKKKNNSIGLDKFLEVIDDFVLKVKNDFLSNFSSEFDQLILKSQFYNINQEKDRFDWELKNIDKVEGERITKYELKKDLLNALTKGNFRYVVIQLQQNFDIISDTKISEELILVISKYNRLDTDNRKGVLSYESYEIGMSQIGEALLIILKKI